jgi:predicted unusual protein kinase regulating ubiquinone biosynthesis (AarF/ABC1/UbiB family)
MAIQDPEDNAAEALRKLFSEPSTLKTSGFGRLAQTARVGIGLGVRTALGRRSPEDFLPLVRSLGELKGLAMKLGQIMSYVDDSLPPEARELLSVLQTHSPPSTFDAIAASVRAELGERAEELLSGMDPKPIASASIGQVHRAVLRDSGHVAVKVQYPEIEAAIRNDFRAADAAIRIVKSLAPGALAFVDEARERLLEECDYRLEASWQERFSSLYAEHPVLRVPGVLLELSGRRVLTTRWQEGLRFDDWLAGDPPQAERNRLGEALYEFYLGSLYRYGLFNADPHPGNYLFARDGALVVLDYGCVREFTKEDVRALAALRWAVRADTEARIKDALEGLGAASFGSKELRPVRALLRAFFGPSLDDKKTRIEVASNTTMRSIMSDKKTLLKLRLPGKLLFLFRIKFGVHAVLARMASEANWSRLEERWLEQRAD